MLATPVAVVQMGLLSQGLVDTAMVGRVTATELGAVTLGNVYFFTVAVFGMGFSSPWIPSSRRRSGRKTMTRLRCPYNADCC